MLDKGRALLAGTNGEYSYACPMDQHFLTFTGVDPEGLKKVLAQGKGDGEVLEWIKANAPQKRREEEVIAWSSYHAKRAPADLDQKEFFSGLLTQCGPDRHDISTWFELLDLDDYVSYGGRA